MKVWIQFDKEKDVSLMEIKDGGAVEDLCIAIKATFPNSDFVVFPSFSMFEKSMEKGDMSYAMHRHDPIGTNGATADEAIYISFSAARPNFHLRYERWGLINQVIEKRKKELEEKRNREMIKSLGKIKPFNIVPLDISVESLDSLEAFKSVKHAVSSLCNLFDEIDTEEFDKGKNESFAKLHRIFRRNNVRLSIVSTKEKNFYKALVFAIVCSDPKSKLDEFVMVVNEELEWTFFNCPDDCILSTGGLKVTDRNSMKFLTGMMNAILFSGK